MNDSRTALGRALNDLEDHMVAAKYLIVLAEEAGADEEKCVVLASLLRSMLIVLREQ